MVDINQDAAYIQLTWLQQPTSAIFRQEIRTVTEYALTYNLYRALFDVRKKFFIDLGDQNRFIREIVPLFLGRKLRFAYLDNPATLKAMDVYRIQDAIISHPQPKNHVQVEVFLGKENAQNWLLL